MFCLNRSRGAASLKIDFLLAICFSTASCSPPKSHQTLISPELLFTTSNFQTSKLLALNDSRVKEVASSLSADPIILGSKQELFLFNRQSTNLNFNKIYTSGSQALYLSSQTLSSPLVPGDPTSAASMDNGHFLLAGYSSGGIFQFSPSSKKITLVALNFDTGGEPFRPYDILVKVVHDQPKLFILHHGLALDFKPNGTEMLFEASIQADGSIVPVDHDPNKDGNQGLKVNSTSPLFLFRESPSPIIAGLCDTFGTNPRCPAERLDLETSRLSPLVDLSQMKSSSSTSITEGLDGNSVLLMTLAKTGGLELRKVSFTGTETSLYSLPNETYQSFVKSDSVRNKIYLGATNSLIEFEGETFLRSHKLDLSPYNGMILP